MWCIIFTAQSLVRLCLEYSSKYFMCICTISTTTAIVSTYIHSEHIVSRCMSGMQQAVGDGMLFALQWLTAVPRFMCRMRTIAFSIPFPLQFSLSDRLGIVSFLNTNPQYISQDFKIATFPTCSLAFAFASTFPMPQIIIIIMLYMLCSFL
jgi:hypothetical protein